MNKSQVTIKDIARKLGIHHSTVSRALRDHPGISSNTKRLVKTKAEEMDYHLDSHAKSFRDRKSMVIGVVVPEIKNEVYSTVISGIEEVAYELGYTIMVSQSNEDSKRELINIRALASNLVAGLLLAISRETTSSDNINILKKRNIPVVLFDRITDGMDVSKVILDDYKGAFKATEYLINQGATRIAHFGGSQLISVGRDRLKGYLNALEKHDIPFDPSLVFTDGSRQEDGTRAFQQLIDNENIPDAVFTANDPMAIGAFQVIKKHTSLRIPDDIKLIGFGNSSSSDLLEPALTTIEQSAYEMGKIASHMLIQKIESGDRKLDEKILEPKIIFKGTT